MCEHTIDKKAFQHAYEAAMSDEADDIRDEFLELKNLTVAEKQDNADKAIYWMFLKAYLEFKG